MTPAEFWERFNQEMATLTPEQADCALGWLADDHRDDVLTAIAYAKDRYREGT